MGGVSSFKFFDKLTHTWTLKTTDLPNRAQKYFSKTLKITNLSQKLLFCRSERAGGVCEVHNSRQESAGPQASPDSSQLPSGP